MLTDMYPYPTVLTAPCDGVIVDVLTLSAGSTLNADEIVAVIEPTEVTSEGGRSGTAAAEPGWQPDLDDAEKS